MDLANLLIDIDEVARRIACLKRLVQSSAQERRRLAEPRRRTVPADGRYDDGIESCFQAIRSAIRKT